jgi:hypothetical protein
MVDRTEWSGGDSLTSSYIGQPYDMVLTIFRPPTEKGIIPYHIMDYNQHPDCFCTWQNPMVDRTEWSEGGCLTSS